MYRKPRPAPALFEARDNARSAAPGRAHLAYPTPSPLKRAKIG
jgi:hypothetical protein